jgi:hypothetical protein
MLVVLHRPLTIKERVDRLEDVKSERSEKPAKLVDFMAR